MLADVGKVGRGQRALAAINTHLCDRMPSGRFVTLALLSIDLETHDFATLRDVGFHQLRCVAVRQRPF